MRYKAKSMDFAIYELDKKEAKKHLGDKYAVTSFINYNAEADESQIIATFQTFKEADIFICRKYAPNFNY